MPSCSSQAVGHLDDADRGEVRVLRQERHRVGEHDLAVGIAHRDRRRVPVAEQVHVGAVHAQRLVHLHDARLRLARPAPAPRRVAVKSIGWPIASWFCVSYDRVELLERQPVGVEGRVVEEAPGVERVVGRERVHERLALDDDALAREPEPAADADGHEHADQRRVEHEVAGLAQVAAFGRHGCLAAQVVALDPVARALAAAAAARSIAASVVSPAGQRPLGVPGEPGEPHGRARRSRPQRLEVVLGARDDAADERHEQQQVDRREPRRRVHVEHLEAVEHRREARVVGEVLRDAVRVARTLRHERAGHRRDREQQQQQQRRAHARELAPGEAQPADEAELRLGDGCVGGSRSGESMWSPGRDERVGVRSRGQSR